jgi:hypothetical protein
MVLLTVSLMLPLSFMARAQETGPRFEVGIVYYADGGAFKALDKEVVAQKGRSNYAARVKGAHATVRLQSSRHTPKPDTHPSTAQAAWPEATDSPLQ